MNSLLLFKMGETMIISFNSVVGSMFFMLVSWSLMLFMVFLIIYTMFTSFKLSLLKVSGVVGNVVKLGLGVWSTGRLTALKMVMGIKREGWD